MRQALFHGCQHVLFAIDLDEHDTIGIEASLRQCREEKVWSCQAPDHLSPGACRDPGRKQCGGRAIDCSGTTPGDLMDGAKGKTVAGQDGIDLEHAEG